jgi:hypothetical protein
MCKGLQQADVGKATFVANGITHKEGAKVTGFALRHLVFAVSNNIKYLSG